LSNAERIAKNESLFREVNERIRELAERFETPAGGFIHFVCECSRLSCSDAVPLTGEEYASVRATRSRFIVRPGHVDDQYERVVLETERYAVVEKIGRARTVAEDAA
jgi:hypothetical protein